jgi:hypothetical protein
MKMIVFWDVAPCGIVEIDRLFRADYCLHHQSDDYDHPDDRGSKHLSNNGQFLQDYTAQHPRTYFCLCVLSMYTSCVSHPNYHLFSPYVACILQITIIIYPSKIDDL